jgi:hypothetical protein
MDRETRTRVLDSASFSGNFGLSLKDKEGIRRNGVLVEAELKGKTVKDCNAEKSKIELKDKTNDVKIKVVYIEGVPGSNQACTAL